MDDRVEDGLIEVPYVMVNLQPGVMSKKELPFFAHEIPLLMVTHGEDAVQVGQATGDTRWLHPEEEYGRLQNRYAGHKNVIEETFGRRMEGRLSDLMGRSLKMFPLPSKEKVDAEEREKNPVKKAKKGRTRLRSKQTD